MTIIIGPYLNAIAIISGAFIGAFLGGRVPETLRTNLTLVFGLCSMSMGVVMIAKVVNMPAMILSILIGTIIGEIILLENGINRLASSTKKIVEKIFPANNKGVDSHDAFLQQFVAIMILFSFSGTGIFGAMNEGMTNDPSVLIVKSFLDFFTAIIFACSLGIPVAAIFIPQTIIQLSLAYCAEFITPLTNATMTADFAATGGMIMVATGLRICAIKSFRVANMLPALLLAMPISALWVQLMN